MQFLLSSFCFTPAGYRDHRPGQNIKKKKIAGLPVTKVYRLHRVLPVTEKYCRLQRNLLFPPLLARRRQPQGTSPVRTVGLPVTENYRLQGIVGYRKICCSHPYWQEASFKSNTDSSFTGYREKLLVTI